MNVVGRTRVRLGDAGAEGIALGIAKESIVSKPQVPYPSAVAPPQPRRLMLAAATALAGVAVAGRHALAQGAGGTLGSRATTFAQDSLNWGAVATIFLYLVAACAVIAGVLGVWQLGKRNQQVSPMMPICAFLAAFIAAGAGTWVAIGSNTLTGSAPSITGASTQPIQFQ